MSRFIAGVDGGQSSTTAAVADESGRILGRGVGPPADLVGEQPGSLRQRNAIQTALAAALRDAGLPSDARLCVLVVGLTGHDSGMPPPTGFDQLADTVATVHDTVIAHAGALGGEPGIVVLAGTGSVAFGNAAPEGPYIRVGGWGYYFGDAGGAVWVAREAIAWAMRDFDEARESQLGDAALRFFNVPDLRAIQQAFARGDLSRPALAAFAAELLRMAPTNPPSMPMQAWHLRNITVNALVELARVVHARLPDVPTRRISYSGGVFASDGVRRTFRDWIERAVTHPFNVSTFEDEPLPKPFRSFEGMEVVEPVGDAVDGALRLSRRLLRGEPVQALFAHD